MRAPPLALPCVLAAALGAAAVARAQQLEPRAYSASPVGTNFAGIAYLHSSGDIALDPALPLKDFHARVDAPAPFYGRVFGLAGRQASASLLVPLVRISAEATLPEGRKGVIRQGFGDPRMRLAVNLIGNPALPPQEFFKHKPRTTLGTSLEVVAPLGQYDGSRLVNIGSNRWAFKPELGLSQPLGRWSLEAYAGVWLFTDNPDFLGHLRRQEPIVTTQAHAVYEFARHAWAAADFTYYTGGTTTVAGDRSDDRQNNTRAGATLSLPLAATQSLKLAYMRGVTARGGTSFTTLGLAWQRAWF